MAGCEAFQATGWEPQQTEEVGRLVAALNKPNIKPRDPMKNGTVQQFPWLKQQFPWLKHIR